jgi:deoxyribose-phosphate aldolase
MMGFPNRLDATGLHSDAAEETFACHANGQKGEYPCGWECTGCRQRKAGPQIESARDAVAAVIDHTLLRPEATREDIRKLCWEARHYGFASVCVYPQWVSYAAGELAGSKVKVCSVAGFPTGAGSTAGKRAEAEAALRDGAREIDMVIDVHALRSGELDAVDQEIRAVAEACHEAGALLKTILETALLDERQKAIAAALAKLAGADFVKTSTGFGPGGATAADVALLRRVVGPDVGVKASGGIRSLAEVQQMLSAGATRIGTSAGVSIVGAIA